MATSREADCPPTEDNPDVYEEGPGLVVIFSSEAFQLKIQTIEETMKSLECHVKDFYIEKFGINSKSQVEEDITQVISKYSAGFETEFKYVIVFFLGQTDSTARDCFFTPDKMNGKIYFNSIWSSFLEVKVPKIFIMQKHLVKKPSSSTSWDAVTLNTGDSDPPLEANNTIIYKCIEDKDDKFIENLCENIKMYCKRDDLFDLLVRTNSNSPNSNNPPTIISTFIRKFYFASSDYRDDVYDIMEEIHNLPQKF